MNEEEKMLAGQIYDANYDKELFQKEIDIIGIEPNFYCDYGFNIYI